MNGHRVKAPLRTGPASVGGSRHRRVEATPSTAIGGKDNVECTVRAFVHVLRTAYIVKRADGPYAVQRGRAPSQSAQ
jgi:hypothetical protein